MGFYTQLESGHSKNELGGSNKNIEKCRQQEVRSPSIAVDILYGT